MNAAYAQLTPSALSQLQQLEAELDSWLVAVPPRTTALGTAEAAYAAVTAAQLERLRAAEQDLGVIILAFEKTAAN